MWTNEVGRGGFTFKPPMADVRPVSQLHSPKGRRDTAYHRSHNTSMSYKYCTYTLNTEPHKGSQEKQSTRAGDCKTPEIG